MNAHKDFIMPATSPGLHEMELNPISLSFPGNLEEAFLEDYCKNSLKAVRLSLLAGIFLYGFFGILDALLIPEMKGTLWFIRFAIVWPSLIGVIAFSYSKQFKKYFQPFVATAMIISGFAIILMIYIIPPPVNYSYYAGLILVLIWGYTFTRVRFLWATTAGWILVALYEIVAVWISETPFSILMSNNFFFISANLVGMFSCYSIEYYTRRDFFLAFQLENEREKVRAANRRLEKIVQERTSQLSQTNKELRSEIEERKRAEEQRKELEGKLEQAQKMKALGTLAGGIAHDFNNLLMGIQGNASLILMDIDSDNPHYEKIRNTEQYVMRGAELTRQLLGFARGGKYQVKSTDLNELIQKSSEMFGRTKKEITIHTNYQDDIWIVNVDRGQIEQVLLNLFVNAWQAMPGGGNLDIITENFSLDKEQIYENGTNPGNYVKVSVIDTGIGMDQEIQKKIFDPFFTTKEMSRGTGLGLASAYGIIKNHDGFIEVSSEVGKGSTFSFYLPATHDEIVALQEPSHHKVLEGTETILLIDDEDMIINVGSGMLKKLGYQVMIATSGEKAVDIYKARKEEIDMVILDMVMPGMSGGKTYDAFKEINQNVKVLLSSGYSMSGDAVEILERGCNGFIQKPFDIRQISRKIRDILDNNKNSISIPVQDYQICIM